MADDKTVVEPIPPVPVTIIGTGTGNGGSPLTTGTVGTTPDHQPNLVVNVVTPLMAIAIRFLHNYVLLMVTLVGAGMTTDKIPARDFAHLLMWSAELSVAGAAFGLLKDLVTVLGRLENKFPLLTGSV